MLFLVRRFGVSEQESVFLVLNGCAGAIERWYGLCLGSCAV